MTTAGRSRGRPRRADAEDRRGAILDVARRQFAAKGFQATSLRAIAAEAGVDVSLIGHYFGGKTPLLVATMELPIDPVEKISQVVAAGPDGLAERLLTTFLDSWDPHRDVFSSLIRTTLASEDAQAPMVHVAREVLVAGLTAVLTGDDRVLRATAVASQLIGLATMRYVVRLDPLAAAPADEVVRLLAPAMQRVIDG
ncbi:MAG: TetR family transcriptional regulator [Aeromicrobium sp.]